MPVHVAIKITNEADDIDKANDWIEDVKDLLKNKVPGKFSSNISNRNPWEELLEENPDG